MSGTEKILIAQKLSSIISAFTGELAATPGGRAWITKALHPSDPIPCCEGIPTMNSRPSIMLNYNMVFIVAPTSQIGSWGFDAAIVPNLFQPLSVRALGPTGIVVTNNSFLNPGLRDPGSAVFDFPTINRIFDGTGIEAHRLTYMGVTAYQDGPALSNQGTLVAAQYPVAREKINIGCPPGALNTGFSTARGVRFQNSDEPNYETSQTMPNAYFGESKDGCYMPLRLDGNFRFVTEADKEFLCAGFTPTNQLPLGVGNSYQTPTAAPGGQGSYFPYPACPQAYWPAAGNFLAGVPVFKPLNDTWGSISVRNLNVSTRFAFYVRLGIECMVTPSSVFAPQQKMSIPYDPVAIASYFRINRELKDAYPSDYNDLGKIWDVIKSAAKVALPIIGGFGPYGAAISGIGNGVMSIVDRASGSGESAEGRKSAPRDKPAMASLERERTQQVVRDSTSTRRAIAKRKKPKGRKARGSSN